MHTHTKVHTHRQTCTEQQSRNCFLIQRHKVGVWLEQIKYKLLPSVNWLLWRLSGRGKKNTVIQKLLLCQKPEVPKEIQVVIPTQIIYPICEMMRRVEFLTLSIKVSLGNKTPRISPQGCLCFCFVFFLFPYCQPIVAPFPLQGCFLPRFLITFARRTHWLQDRNTMKWNRRQRPKQTGYKSFPG